MATLATPTSLPNTGLKLRLSPKTSPSPTLTPQTGSSPDTNEDQPNSLKDRLKDVSESNFNVDTTPSKKSCDTNSENTSIVETPTLSEESIATIQTELKPKKGQHPRKWRKRSLVIRTLTGEVCFSSWCPDGAPLLKRPITLEKFSSPHPIVDSSRPVQCTYPGCNRNFADQSGLTKHLVIHGPKTFFCGLDGCTKSFADRTRLRRHQRGVHGQ
ncbi:Transcriptional repressor protein yy1 [Basidiobolus ranarum]|uniref:Transcriptional repressor protein yy1 n=1 Tax=Basidiobolus ranarum TaxID=34480 RepID=A0ABR2W563_9FUNG